MNQRRLSKPDRNWKKLGAQLMSVVPKRLR